MDVEDTEACYRAVKSRDRRFDGVFYTGVTSTGIYCRPSCPARTPARSHVTFHRSAAAAQAAGFRACKRCRPDAVPGSPAWDTSADAAGRAMRLVCDGVVEREGVEGLARRIGYTPRHLHRLLVVELGAGPLALARARRAQNARVLVETTAMPMSDVAHAAGFASVRQFNDTVREVYATTPTALRARTRPPGDGTAGVLRLRLPVRAPYAAAEVLRFLAAHVVPGVEASGDDWYARTVRLPHGHGRVRLVFPVHEPAGSTSHVDCELHVADLRDVGAAVERCRRLVDADSDPLAVDDELGADPLMARLVRARPGLRVPGGVDGDETAVRAVLGQQISLAGAISLAGKLVARFGETCSVAGPAAPDRMFPSMPSLAALDPEELPMPRARGRALVALATSLASGEMVLDRGAHRPAVRSRLLALPGIGPWTADYVALRALGDPDVFLSTDVGVRRALTRLGEDPGAADTLSRRWRPWRSYGLLHLWSTLDLAAPSRPPHPIKET